MKKLITTTAVLLSALTFAVAQDAGASDFKPAGGANNLELNFVPLNGKPIQLTYIRYRRFFSEKNALRLGIGVSYSSSKDDVMYGELPTGATDSTYTAVQHKKTQLGWNIKPGFEHHFEGTNRLSPYMGFELDIAGQSSKEITPQKGGFDFVSHEAVVVTEKNKSKGGFLRAGVNLVAGFDCYVTKHLYLGTELGFGFQWVKYSDYVTTIAYPSSVTPVPSDPPAVTQGSEINIGPNFNSSIRLGYIF